MKTDITYKVGGIYMFYFLFSCTTEMSMMACMQSGSSPGAVGG